ncbi:MAG: hypothetical protein ACKERG_01135 [Candidatus Hodgkinia cicadicola]
MSVVKCWWTAVLRWRKPEKLVTSWEYVMCSETRLKADCVLSFSVESSQSIKRNLFWGSWRLRGLQSFVL